MVVAFKSGGAANGHMREVEGRRRRPCKAGEGAVRGKRREEAPTRWKRRRGSRDWRKRLWVARGAAAASRGAYESTEWSVPWWWPVGTGERSGGLRRAERKKTRVRCRFFGFNDESN